MTNFEGMIVSFLKRTVKTVRTVLTKQIKNILVPQHHVTLNMADDHFLVRFTSR